MRFLEFFFEKGEPSKKDMTIKTVLISSLISVVLSVLIVSFLHANGINIQGDSILGWGIFVGMNFVSFYTIKWAKGKIIK